MSPTDTHPVRFRVDPANPGQFFACCGLLELADRLWDGAEGWFETEGQSFCIRHHGSDNKLDYTSPRLIATISDNSLTNTMTACQLKRRDELRSISKKERESNANIKTEKKALDKLWRESPLILQKPFNLKLDWFLNQHADATVFKTWAGQQSVFEIARGLKATIRANSWRQIPPEEWLERREYIEGLPFNFDSDLGGLGSDLDVGFSFDPLETIHVQSRPLLEFAGFIGLQRFRPARINGENCFRYYLWFDPFLPEVASTAACGLTASLDSKVFQFRLLYRTKYLKSFLAAIPVERSQ